MKIKKYKCVVRGCRRMFETDSHRFLHMKRIHSEWKGSLGKPYWFEISLRLRKRTDGKVSDVTTCYLGRERFSNEDEAIERMTKIKKNFKSSLEGSE